MVVINSGTFQMGAPQGEAGRGSDEGPPHEVTIVKPFALSRCEVTVAEFRYFIDSSGYRTEAEKKDGCFGWNDETGRFEKRQEFNWENPGFPQNAYQPVTCVSWDDAVAYIDWLSERTGQRYRLPTEAEWEYAARAGQTTRHSWGDEIDCSNARYGFVSDECGKQASTDPVSSFPANSFGLYDVHGNVWEWVEDCLHGNYRDAPLDGSAWLDGNQGDCARRMLRGGSWYDRPDDMRSAQRKWNTRGGGTFFNGFRLARDL